MAVPEGQEQRDRLGVKSAGDEGERLDGRGVGPVGVVDQAQQWPLAGDLGQQGESGDRDQELVGGWPGLEPECHSQRPCLRLGQAAGLVQDRAQEPVQGGVGQRGLRLHPVAAQHPHLLGPLAGVGQQGRLADARLTAEDQASALSAPSTLDETVDRGLLCLSSEEHGRIVLPTIFPRDPGGPAWTGSLPDARGQCPSVGSYAMTESKGAPTVSEQEVLDLVQRWAEVELRGDADAYGDLLAPDFIGVGPVGFVLTRDQWAERHRGDLKNEETASRNVFFISSSARRRCAALRSYSRVSRIACSTRFDSVTSTSAPCQNSGSPLRSSRTSTHWSWTQ